MSTARNSKRVVTSAIDGMSVSKVRRGLDSMRKLWRERSDARPFFISQPVVDNMTMQTFALRFVMGHHYKRHIKSTTPRTREDGLDDEEEEEEQDDQAVLGDEEEQEEQEEAARKARKRARSKK